MYVNKYLIALFVFVSALNLVNYFGSWNDLVVRDGRGMCPGSTLVVERPFNGKMTVRCVPK